MRIAMKTTAFLVLSFLFNLCKSDMCPETTSICPGVRSTATMEFGVDKDGKSFQVGDTPERLPNGVLVHGWRSDRSGFELDSGKNDLLVTKVEGGADESLSQSGEHAEMGVVIGQASAENPLTSNPNGGVIFVHFQSPVYQVNSVRVSKTAVSTGSQGVVTGTGIYNEKLRAVSIPPNLESNPIDVSLPNFYNLQTLQVAFGSSLALLSLNITMCQRKIDGSYRTFKGLENIGGEVGERLLRKSKPNYPHDGSGEEIYSVPTMPNPRNISNMCVMQTDLIPNERGLSDMVWAFGQFLDHDLDLSVADESAGDGSIPVPDSADPMFPAIPMTRSSYDPATGKDGIPREQTNAITAAIDGSVVYGSDKERAHFLRTFEGGKLKMFGGSDVSHTLLPIQPADNDLENEGHEFLEKLFIAGDVRANEQVGLTAMHTLFVREHNYMAQKIASANPGATDEAIYQMARKIVAAEIQKITYTEFLPALMGEERAPKYTGYNDQIDTSIATEFSTAAYRFGHTLLPPTLKLVDNNGEEMAGVSLRDAFFNTTFLIDKPKRVDYLISGFTRQKAQELDLHIVEDVRNFLFGAPGAGGLDLAALNIQRGRDHGLSWYNDVREAYGLPALETFDLVTSNTERQECLQAVYGTPDLMDLWVGVLAEDHMEGSSVGPLLAAILNEQFGRLMNGDQYYYQNDPDFSSPEMEFIVDIHAVKFSDIIRRNTRSVVPAGSNVFFVQ